MIKEGERLSNEEIILFKKIYEEKISELYNNLYYEK